MSVETCLLTHYESYGSKKSVANRTFGFSAVILHGSDADSDREVRQLSSFTGIRA